MLPLLDPLKARFPARKFVAFQDEGGSGVGAEDREGFYWTYKEAWLGGVLSDRSCEWDYVCMSLKHFRSLVTRWWVRQLVLLLLPSSYC